MKTLALFLYYAVASKLPDLAFPLGRFFNGIRCFLLHRILASFGDGNEVDSRIYLGDGSDVQVGSRCQINAGCRLGRVKIGSYVMIGPDVVILSQLHRTDSIRVPMASQGSYEREPTVIEDDVWIGIRAVVMPGVTIAKGAIVGANAVVTGDVAPYTVVGGVPAKLIKMRVQEP